MQFDDRDMAMLAIVLIVVVSVVGEAFGLQSKVPELAIAAIAGFVTGQRTKKSGPGV